MNKFVLSITLALFTIFNHAQVPQGISHQAVIRNAGNQLITNTMLGVKVSILQDSPEEILIYSETHNPISNTNGLVTFVIGNGNVLFGSFESIDWAGGPFFLKTEADLQGGSNYSIVLNSPLLSVPYVLHSGRISQLERGSISGEMLYWDGEMWIRILPGDEDDQLTFCNGMPMWGGCIPQVITSLISGITSTAAISGGNVINDNGYEVGERGVCWSTSTHPDINDSKTIDENGKGEFVSHISGLKPGQTYYLRAYATNCKGTAYGIQYNFKTLPASNIIHKTRASD